MNNFKLLFALILGINLLSSCAANSPKIDKFSSEIQNLSTKTEQIEKNIDSIKDDIDSVKEETKRANQRLDNQVLNYKK